MQSLVHCLVLKVYRVLCAALKASQQSLGNAKADAKLGIALGGQVVIQWPRTLLLFLVRNPNGNHRFLNSFRNCQSQFEKHCPGLFQVVSLYVCVCFNSGMTEEIRKSLAIVVNEIL